MDPCGSEVSGLNVLADKKAGVILTPQGWGGGGAVGHLESRET